MIPDLRKCCIASLNFPYTFSNSDEWLGDIVTDGDSDSDSVISSDGLKLVLGDHGNEPDGLTLHEIFNSVPNSINHYFYTY